MATINEIKQQAAAVKNATQVGENTAIRVGGALAGLADIAEQQDTEIGKKFDKENIVQESGDSEDKVMSQKAVSDKLRDLEKKQDIIPGLNVEEKNDDSQCVKFTNDDGTETIHEIAENYADFRNLKSNGHNVATENNLEKKQDIIPGLNVEEKNDDSQCVKFTNGDGTETYVKISDKGIEAKNFINSDGIKIKGLNSVTVDKTGNGDYKTITDAINNTNDGDIIFIMKGEYEEHIDMYNKKRHLIGISKDEVKVVTHDGLRSNNPCNANVGIIENMSFIAMIDKIPDNYYELEGINRATYGLHCDARYISSDRHELIIRNCRCVSYAHAGIGIGIRYNQTITIENCELVSYNDGNGGFLMHNDDFYPNSNGGVIRVINCIMRGTTKAISISSLNNNALCELEFINNTCYAEKDGIKSIDNIVPTSVNNKWGNDISNSILSHNNNTDLLNFKIL